MKIEISFFLLVFAYACNTNTEPAQGDFIDSTLEISNNTFTTVKTVVSMEKPFIYVLRCNGQIRSAKEQAWFAESSGLIKFFRGQNGSRYSPNEAIVQFDNSLAALKLERASLNRFNTQREYESLLLGYKSLLNEKSDANVDSIKKKLRISSGLALAEQDIAEAQYELNHTVITAPFHGVLANVNIQTGQRLKEGDLLFTLYSDRDLFLDAEVLETDLALIHKGQLVDVYPISDTTEEHRGTVYDINPYVRSNGMISVRIKISATQNASANLYPGMHGFASINIPFGNSLVVPKEAVVIRSGKAVVFSISNGKAQWNDVQIGRDNGSEVEVKSGIKPGVKVIVTNNLQLAHDSPVMEEAPAS